ncbi:alpha/beta fold hydrolase [Streptomyces cellulosae]|uniref:Alpha/beta fold hydrolase n=1 Tax=Streptomyces cellulosae TaxID=1968 RepID=A0ABW7YG23_STRCE
MLPVLFVHGLIGPFAEERTLSQLQPSVLLAPDLLGYGADADVAADSITIDAQVAYVQAAVERAVGESRVHLVAHSVGFVIAATFAHRFPERVAKLVSVEGNFTLADAFWSAQLARMTPGEVHDLLESDRRDPQRWLRDAGVHASAGHVRAAAEALAFQPSTTLQAMARAVVEYTGEPAYERLLKAVFARTPVHLVAGARSRAGWDVPRWALHSAAGYTEVPRRRPHGDARSARGVRPDAGCAPQGLSGPAVGLRGGHGRTVTADGYRARRPPGRAPR